MQHRISQKIKEKKRMSIRVTGWKRTSLNGNESIGLNVISARLQSKLERARVITRMENENNDEYAHENSFGGQVGLRGLRN